MRKILPHTDTLPPDSPARNALLQHLRYYGSARRRYRRRIHCQRPQRRQYFSLVTYHTALKFPPLSAHNSISLTAQFLPSLITQHSIAHSSFSPLSQYTTLYRPPLISPLSQHTTLYRPQLNFSPLSTHNTISPTAQFLPSLST